MRQSTGKEAPQKEALLRVGIEVSQLEAKLDLEPQTDPRSRGVIVRQNCQALAPQFRMKAQPGAWGLRNSLTSSQGRI